MLQATNTKKVNNIYPSLSEDEITEKDLCMSEDTDSSSSEDESMKTARKIKDEWKSRLNFSNFNANSEEDLENVKTNNLKKKLSHSQDNRKKNKRQETLKKFVRAKTSNESFENDVILMREQQNDRLIKRSRAVNGLTKWMDRVHVSQNPRKNTTIEGSSKKVKTVTEKLDGDIEVTFTENAVRMPKPEVRPGRLMTIEEANRVMNISKHNSDVKNFVVHYHAGTSRTNIKAQKRKEMLIVDCIDHDTGTTSLGKEFKRSDSTTAKVFVTKLIAYEQAVDENSMDFLFSNGQTEVTLLKFIKENSFEKMSEMNAFGISCWNKDLDELDMKRVRDMIKDELHVLLHSLTNWLFPMREKITEAVNQDLFDETSKISQSKRLLNHVTYAVYTLRKCIDMDGGKKSKPFETLNLGEFIKMCLQLMIGFQNHLKSTFDQTYHLIEYEKERISDIEDKLISIEIEKCHALTNFKCLVDSMMRRIRKYEDKKEMKIEFNSITLRLESERQFKSNEESSTQRDIVDYVLLENEDVVQAVYKEVKGKRKMFIMKYTLRKEKGKLMLVIVDAPMYESTMEKRLPRVLEYEVENSKQYLLRILLPSSFN